MSSPDWELRDFARGREAASLRATPTGTGMVLLLLAAIFAAALAWSSWAVIEEVARADGRVVPSGRARIVESLEGGIVREIFVREGDTVAAGAVLVRIDDTGAAASLGELAAQQAALSARAHRLKLEAEGATTSTFDAGIAAADEALVLRETAVFDSRLASYLGQRAVLEAQLRQEEQRIQEAANAMARVGEAIAFLDEEITLRTESGVVPRAQILPLERERSARRQERDGLESQRDQGRIAVAEAQARLTELELQRRAEINTDRADTLNQLSVIEESIKRASDVVARTSLRAPVNGVVSQLNVNTLGAVIAPGEEVLRIVPDDDRLEVEARVRPEDIAFIRLDLPARVKLTSFDFTIYGALDGRVIRIGADSETDETTGASYFPIIVETDRNTLDHDGANHEIRPGMVATVDILTGERTVLDYLLKPFRKARLEALRER